MFLLSVCIYHPNDVIPPSLRALCILFRSMIPSISLVQGLYQEKQICCEKDFFKQRVLGCF